MASTSTAQLDSGAGPSCTVVATVEHGHCNPLDDTILANSQQPGSLGPVRMLDSSFSDKTNRRLSRGKKGSVELVPIVSVGPSDTRGYVNELALEEPNGSNESLHQVVQEYRLEDDSDDSSQYDLKRSIN